MAFFESWGEDRRLAHLERMSKLGITPESIAQRHGVSVDCVRIGETPEGGAYTIIAQGGRYISFTEYDENHNEVFRTSGYLTE